MASVLALGLDPVHADFQAMPDLTPELIRVFIEAQLQRVRSLGHAVEGCLVNPDDTARPQVAQCLARTNFDCVVIGAGLREPAHLLLLEQLLNLIHRQAPQAKICFNTSPVDTAEAVQRWVR